MGLHLTVKFRIRTEGGWDVIGMQRGRLRRTGCVDRRDNDDWLKYCTTMKRVVLPVERT